MLSGPTWAQPPSVAIQPSPIHAIPDSQDDLAAAQAALGASASPAEPDAEPSPPPASNVAVARKIVDAAGAFDGYMRRAAAIKADFSTGASVVRAVRLGSTYQAEQLQEGATAYAALAALQDPDFVAAISEVARNPQSNEGLASQLLQQPEAVLATPAARRAITRVSEMLGRMGLQLVTAGAAVKQSAYDVQRQAWSKDAVLNSDKQLAMIKAQSDAPITLASADTQHLFTDLTALRTTEADAREAEAATPMVVHGLAIAALAILGRAGDDQMQAIAPLLGGDKEGQCLKMARLNLNQCLAVAGPNYEDLFCLGHHAMMETGQCIASAAGVSDAAIHAVSDTTSVRVPIATAAAAPAKGVEWRSAFTTAMPAKADDVTVPLAQAIKVNYSPYDGPTGP